MSEQKQNNMLVEYNVTTAAIQELKTRYSIVPAVESSGDLKNLKKSIADVRTLRTSVEAKRKELKKEALERGRMIDCTANEIKEQLLEIELPMKEAKEEYEEKIKAEKEAKAKAERERIEAIQQRINELSMLPTKMVNSSSDEIAEALNSMAAADDFDYEEFTEQHNQTYKTTLEAMAEIHTSTLKREVVEIKLAKQKAENDERDRLAKIEADKLAEEKAKFEEEQRKAKAAAKKKEQEQAAEESILAKERRKLDDTPIVINKEKPVVKEPVEKVPVTKEIKVEPAGDTIKCPNCGEEIVLAAQPTSNQVGGIGETVKKNKYENRGKK